MEDREGEPDPIRLLTQQQKRLHPLTGFLLLALAVAAIVVALDIVLSDDGGDGAERANRVIPPPEGKSDVEWREDGIYVKGEKQVDQGSEPEDAAEPQPAGASAGAAEPSGGSSLGGSVAKDIGQKIMSRMSGTSPGAGLLRRVRAGQIGGVILFSDNIRSVDQVRRAVGQLQDAASSGGNPPLLISIDQEGGTVKRFVTLPPRASAAAMAAGGTASREGRATASALAGAGVNLNLAPVADVAQVANSFLGTRAFGRDSRGVARSACAFSRGQREGGVFPTLKHFPGLGTAGANTDFDDVTIRASAATIRAGYAPYRRCANDGLVMVANARYPALTGSLPAVLAPRTYTRELRRVGFSGVTISDDLQAAGVDPIPELAVKTSRAGLDILLYAKTEQAAALAYTQMQRAVQRGGLSAAKVRASARKIRALKEGLGG